MAKANKWNVWRWLDSDGGRSEWVGRADTLPAAMSLAKRLGGHQVQHGVSGDVYGVA